MATHFINKFLKIIKSTDGEKVLNKSPYTFMIKTEKIRIDKHFLQLIKGIFIKNQIDNIILNERGLNAFPIKSGAQPGCLLFTTTSIQHGSKKSSPCNNAQKNIKSEEVGKEEVNPFIHKLYDPRKPQSKNHQNSKK